MKLISSYARCGRHIRTGAWWEAAGAGGSEIDHTSTGMDQLRERLAGDLSILKDDSLSETIVELLLESPTLTTSGALEDSEEMIRSCLPHLTEVKRTELILKLRERMDAFYAEQEGGEEWEEELEVHEREGLCQLCGANQRITIHHLIPKVRRRAWAVR